jgi:translocation and assembly module TamB
MRRLALALAALAVVLVLGAAGFTAWLAGTEAGLQWLVARARSASGGRLVVEGASGVLAGRIGIERLAFGGDAFSVEMRRIDTRLDLVAALGGRVALRPLRAASLDLSLADTPGAAPGASPPLPFGVRLDEAEVDELRVHRAGETFALQAVRLEHAALDAAAPTALSAAGSFRRADERFPASGSIRAEGSLERAAVSLELRVAEVPVRARALLTPFQPRALQSLEARAGPLDLGRFDAGLPRTALTVELNGQADAQSALRGTLRLDNALAGPLDAGRLPVARLESRFATEDFGAAHLDALRIALAGGGALEGQGDLGPARVEAQLRASAIDLRALQSSLRRTALRGRLDLVLTAGRQALEGLVEQEGMSLAAHVVRAGEELQIRALRAAAGGGEASGSGRVRLDGTLAFEARLAATRFDPSAFGDYPAGSINGEIAASGRLAGERGAQARWAVRDSTLLGLPLASSGTARFALRRVTQADARASLGTARVSARGDFGRPGDVLAWRLDAPRLEELEPKLAGSLRASGVLRGAWQRPEASIEARARALRVGGRQLDELTARLAGSLERHEAAIAVRAPGVDLTLVLGGRWAGGAWSGELRSAANVGEYPLRLVAPTPLAVAPHRVEVGRLEATLADGRILVRSLRWTPERTETSGEFRRLPAQWLIVAAGAAQRARADLLLDGDWSLTAAPRLDGSVRVRRAGGDVVLLAASPVALGLAAATLEARFAAGRATASAQAQSRFGSFDMKGTLGPAPEGKDAASGIGLTAASPLALDGRFAFTALRELSQPLLEEARLDGRLSADLRVRGTLGAPLVEGTLLGEALAFDYPPYGVYLKDGALRAKLEGDRVRIEELSVRAGEGEFTASGTLPLRFADGGARIGWQARSLAILERPDLRLVASGQGSAQFDGEKLALSGDLRAERGLLEFDRDRLPKLGEDVWVAGKPRPVGEQRRNLPVSLDVHLELGSNLVIRAQGLEGKLTGAVDLATTNDGELRAYGKVQTLNATLFAYGQKLQVDPGIVIFDGPLDNPSLQVTAWRRNQAVEAGVQLTGTLRAPRVEVVSQPPVPEGERLSWLVLGRAPSDATKADLGMLQAAAGALLSSGDSVPVDQKLARAVGLDEVSLKGSGELQESVVAFGKRLSDRLYVSYEQGLGAVPSNLVKLDYSLSRRWSVRAETGTASGWGLFYRFSWD